MRTPMLLLPLVVLACLDAQDMPRGLRTSTWVREDIFAGFLEGDMNRFQQGVAKIDRILAANPRAANAVAWKGGAELYLAVRAHEAGDEAGFRSGYAKARELFAKASAIAVETPASAQGVYAITGGSYTAFADRAPSAQSREFWEQVRVNYTALRALQQPAFDKYPPHFRGEVLAGLAQAELRLGDGEKGKTLAADLVAALPGTPYALFAQRMLDKPATVAKAKLTCLTCHDSGRLQAVLERLPKN
jgi:hypothetical protein